MKAYRGVAGQLHHSIWQYMEVSGQLHAQASLLPVKQPPVLTA
jgi:hypothetical protein